MASPQEQRKIRLQNDYKQMLNIRGNIIEWQPKKGVTPYIEEYELTVNIKSIISSVPDYRNQHIIQIILPANYPIKPPETKIQGQPSPFHPNWYENGRWCHGTWDFSEGLGVYVVRMIKTLQFDLSISNPKSPANRGAVTWFKRNLNKNIFPCDKTPLPDPTKSRFTVKPKKPNKFIIK